MERKRCSYLCIRPNTYNYTRSCTWGNDGRPKYEAAQITNFKIIFTKTRRCQVWRSAEQHRIDAGRGGAANIANTAAFARTDLSSSCHCGRRTSCFTNQGPCKVHHSTEIINCVTLHWINFFKGTTFAIWAVLKMLTCAMMQQRVVGLCHLLLRVSRVNFVEFKLQQCNFFF